MTQANGHPQPPTEAPAVKQPQVLSRRLFIEETTSEGMREVWEVTDGELLAECSSRGILRDGNDAGIEPRALACNRTRRLRCPCGACEEMRVASVNEARDTEPPPSEDPNFGNAIEGDALSAKRPSLKSAVEARMAKQCLTMGDAAMARVEALIQVLEERL